MIRGGKMFKKSLGMLGMFLLLFGCQPVEVEVTEAVPVMTSLPSYLKSTIPEPGKSYTLTDYETLATSRFWGAGEPAICVYISATPFVEPGDFFGAAIHWVEDRVYLVVDDTIITEVHSLGPTDSEGGEKIDPETGKVIARGPDGSPMTICYAAPLDTGIHTATLVVKKTSGEQVTYTWQFRITE
jgi:hypothetical protein